ncbi:unnamed protein product [Dracunculus medinensis]|uniref:NR LBD domain-containing protein n=1 Tax=Dracunculus medinensis TaxID=318479 RepID=A0A0N4UL66_DRAME|nr:unnamed protein product [Dracunculus medinensis]
MRLQPSSPYSQRIEKIVFAASFLLWPINSQYILAKFLAFKQFYAHLLEYCQLNKPYVLGMNCSFYYFEGVAYAGLQEPHNALNSFLVAYEIMKSGEGALSNDLFSYVDTNDDSTNITETEFLIKVMGIMEQHNYSEQLVTLGLLALKDCDNKTLLPDVYNILFKSELLTNRYQEALHTLLSNPVNDTRRNCLRELLSRLLENNKREILVHLNYKDMEEYVNIVSSL